MAAPKPVGSKLRAVTPKKGFFGFCLARPRDSLRGAFLFAVTFPSGFMAHLQWDIYMGAQRAHIILPQELVREIDLLVGPRGRSAFLVETARAELRRRRLLSFLRNDKPAWKAKAHPELAAGAGAWVKSLRQEGEARVPRGLRAEKRPK